MMRRMLHARCVLLAASWAASMPVHAMQQCPEWAGTKSPWVDLAGWSIVALAVAAGSLFAGWIIRRGWAMGAVRRLILAVLGIAGMLLVWLVGLGIAVAFFFLRC